jgi:hypothetical protein
MKQTVVRYKAKPEKVEENQRLIREGVSNCTRNRQEGCAIWP